MLQTFSRLYMKAKFSPIVQQKILQINKKDKNLVVRIEKQITLFESNRKHPSLRTHKLKGSLAEYWAYSINYQYRILFRFINNHEVLLLDIGTHSIY